MFIHKNSQFLAYLTYVQNKYYLQKNFVGKEILVKIKILLKLEKLIIILQV